MSKFSKEILEKTLSKEGGYTLSNHKNDRGGLTFAGISQKMHPTWFGWSAINGQLEKNKDADILVTNEIQELVEVFYRTEFWDRGAHKIKNSELAEILFDISVNIGWRQANKILQRSANKASNCHIVVDGVLGPLSLTCISMCNQDELKMTFLLETIAHYSKIVENDQTQSVFLRGWVNRALSHA